MRVLIFTFEFVPFSGGIATYAREVAVGLSHLGVEVGVLAPSYPSSAEVDTHAPFRTVRMGVSHGGPELFRFLPGTRDYLRELRSFQPDVVLLASDLAHGIGGVVGAARSVPFVPVVHGSEITKHFPPTTAKERLQSLPLKRCYSTASAIVCVSGFVRSLMLDAGFDPNDLNVIHNGIDRSLLDAPVDMARVAETRRRWGIEKRPTLLTLARLVERKGQSRVIDALPEILRLVPEARYVIAGVGPDAGRLRALAHRLGVQEAVVFTGEIEEDEKIHLLDACDVFVMPSGKDGRRVEGLGISLLEAGARGMALVGGRHGGVPEIVEDAETGLLVDPDDPQEIASRLGHLLADRDSRTRLGDRARDEIEARFLTDRMACSLRDLLTSVVSAS